MWLPCHRSKTDPGICQPPEHEILGPAFLCVIFCEVGTAGALTLQRY